MIQSDSGQVKRAVDDTASVGKHVAREKRHVAGRSRMLAVTLLGTPLSMLAF